MRNLFFCTLLLLLAGACSEGEIIEGSSGSSSSSEVVDAAAFEQKAVQDAIAKGIISISSEDEPALEKQTGNIQTRAVSGFDPRSWMSKIDGSLYLSQLSIPGTHNSAANVTFAACQSGSITQQLNWGVRALDMRCRHVNNSFMLHHGAFYLEKTFGEVMIEIQSFLKAHPTETIVMFMKEEHTSAETTRSFEQTFRNLYLTQSYGSLFYLKDAMPTLNEVRGKIVLVRRFSASSTCGISTSWQDNATFTSDRNVKLRVQDKYKVDNCYGMDWKWAQCKAMFAESISTNEPQTLYVNYLSGSGGALLPYSCAEGIMGYWGMNYQLFRMLEGRLLRTQHLGIVMQDYIGDDYHTSNIARTNNCIKVVSVSSEETVGEGPSNGRGKHAFDNTNSTWWHTQWTGSIIFREPKIRVKLDNVHSIKGIRFQHRPRTSTGRPNTFYVQYRVGNNFVTVPVPSWAGERDKSSGIRNLNVSGDGYMQYSFERAVSSDEFIIAFPSIHGSTDHTFMAEIELFE